MNPEELEALVEIVKEYLPVVKEVVPLITELREDLIPLVELLSDDLVDIQCRMYNRYEDKGFKHEDIMQLILHHKISLADLIKKK